MLGTLADSFDFMVRSFIANLPFVLWCLAALWVIHFINFSLKYRLNAFGILPRKLIGLPGIILSPLLHGHATHLLFNTLPLFILMSLVLMAGKSHFYAVTVYIVLISGAATWLMGRRAIHIGASGLAMGYWGYLLITAVRDPSIMTIALGVLCLYYLGSMVANLFPLDAKSSWEWHVFGFLAGVGVSFFL